MRIKVHHFLPRTRVEGPGFRACLWVQGCSLACPGCAVKSSWPKRGGTWKGVDELADRILKEQGLEGVTFVGGEPFDQALALSELAQKLRYSGLSVITFTGYRLEDLEARGQKDVMDLLSLSDILIDGPYQRDKPEKMRPWIGSSNQRIHFLTERYRFLEGNLESIKNGLEIRIAKNGVVRVNGMIPSDAPNRSGFGVF